MADDSTAPATKGDVRQIVQEAFISVHEKFGSIDQTFTSMDQRFASIEENMRLIYEFLVRNEVKIDEIKKDLEERMERNKKEVQHHFDVVAENIRHDFLHGAIADKVSQHEDRIRRLEERFVRK